MRTYTGVKVFSATKAQEREAIGTKLTKWIADNPDAEIVDTVVKQSSDEQFHCLSVLIFFR